MTRWVVVALGLAMAFVSVPARAQVIFGPQFVWGGDTDSGVGARVDFDLAGPLAIDDGLFQHLFGSATGSYFFRDCPPAGTDQLADCGFIEINGNANIPFTITGSSVSGYLGGGLHLARYSVDYSTPEARALISSEPTFAQIGLNLLGGIKFPLSGLTGFVEGKFGLVGAEQFVFSAGLLIG
jgi:hypothetical protein